MIDTPCGAASTLVIDVDGTLYPTAERVQRTYETAAREVEQHLTRQAAGRGSVVIAGNEPLVVRLHRISGLSMSEIIDSIYQRVDLVDIVEAPLITEELLRLQPWVHLAVMSNAPEQHVRRVLDVLGLTSVSLTILGMDTLSFATKPEADAYLRMLHILDLRPDEVIFLDDSKVNVLAAQSLGIRSILIVNAEPQQIPLALPQHDTSITQSTLLTFLRRCSSASQEPETKV